MYVLIHYDYPEYVISIAYVKMAAAAANAELGVLDKTIANAIIAACCEIVDGKFHDQFPIDMMQGGAGTSVNLNANEVIANRALELLGHKKGEYQYCSPNDHVNCAQSTNDAYPTAFRYTFVRMNKLLVASLQALIAAFRAKGVEFKDFIKMGRTQLQDAVPMTAGQEFNAFANNLEEEIANLDRNAVLLREINMGGTAIGTGLNAVPGFAGPTQVPMSAILLPSSAWPSSSPRYATTFASWPPDPAAACMRSISLRWLQARPSCPAKSIPSSLKSRTKSASRS